VTLIRGSAVRLVLRTGTGRWKARKSTNRSKGMGVGKLEGYSGDVENHRDWEDHILHGLSGRDDRRG